MRKRWFVAVILFFGSNLLLGATHTLTPDERAVIDVWLRMHPSFRLAADADCDCQADIRTKREGQGGVWKPVPDYHPYVARGDFNGDGAIDIAVAVVNRSRHVRRFTLLVFNGPFTSQNVNPAFVERDVDMRHTGLFFGPPRPKPYRLVIGEFESEGMILIPNGKSYRYEPVSPVEE